MSFSGGNSSTHKSFFFQAEDGIRDVAVTGVQTCALPIFEDQVQHGIYRTETDQVKMPDPITQQQKTVTIVKLVVDKNGQKERTDTSPLQDFGIRTYNPSINEIVYDKVVEEQIAQQQKA